MDELLGKFVTAHTVPGSCDFHVVQGVVIGVNPNGLFTVLGISGTEYSCYQTPTETPDNKLAATGLTWLIIQRTKFNLPTPPQS